MNELGPLPPLASLLEATQSQWDIRIAVLGGGTGGPRVISGLINYPVHVDSVTTMFDSGGSSGILGKKFGIQPPSDFMRAILAHVASENPDLVKLLTARFPKDPHYEMFAGHPVGNIAFFALEAAGFSRAESIRIFVNALTNIRGLRGTPYPVSLEKAHIITVLADGSEHEGEAYLDDRKIGEPPISYIYLKPPVIAYVGAVEAVQKADLAVASMGSFYGSTIATMLPMAMPEALALAGGLAFPLPLMTMPNETHGYQPIDYVERLLKHIPGVKKLAAVLVNDGPIPPEIEAEYAAKSSFPVRITPEQKKELEDKYCDEVILGNYIDESWMRLQTEKGEKGKLRHNSDALARDLIRVAHRRYEMRREERHSVNVKKLLKQLDHVT